MGEGGHQKRSCNGKRRERESSKSLILKDSSVRSIWTYLTASPCYTTNTNKQRDRETDRQTDRQTDRDRRQTDRESSKSVMLKDSSVRSIWT